MQTNNDNKEKIFNSIRVGDFYIFHHSDKIFTKYKIIEIRNRSKSEIESTLMMVWSNHVYDSKKIGKIIRYRFSISVIDNRCVRIEMSLIHKIEKLLKL